MAKFADRRRFLQVATAAGVGVWSGTASRLFAEGPPAGAGAPGLKQIDLKLGLREKFTSPVKVASIEVIENDGKQFVRATSTDGAIGIIPANFRLKDVRSLFDNLAVPFFVGKDARDLERLVDEIYLDGRIYKYASFPFWTGVAQVELSLIDMLGKISGQPAGALLGNVIREEIPVYVTRLTRDTTPAEEVADLARALAQTGAGAVKVKLGGRMKNTPADAARTNRLIPLLREELGDQVVIYTDANSSYTVEEAIEVGRMLEDHEVAFFEEPVPWPDFAGTKRVADALKMTVAGGEQDSDMYKWQWMIDQRALDLVQPDIIYNGGLIRGLRVARLAAEAGIKITPHSPKSGLEAAPMLHFASIVPNLGGHQEYTAWNEIRGGVVPVPKTPGLGLEYEPSEWKNAKPV